MRQWHDTYPWLGLDKHKGYPTRDHLAAIAEYGVCEQHRTSFAPVARYLASVS